jgi:hypothetical protein
MDNFASARSRSSPRMRILLFSLLAGFLAGCAQHPQPAILTPARTSNKATRASITETRGLIKKSQDAAAKGADSLDAADKTLSALLGK